MATVIAKEERSAIAQRLLAIAPDNLALIFSGATGGNATWIKDRAHATNVVEFMDSISIASDLAIAVCTQLVAMFPSHVHNSSLNNIINRLNAQAGQAAADPLQELWIGSEPMVNRSALRSLLHEIASGFHHGVIYVAGGAMSGRSHSFQLIRHVARSKGIPYHKVDFAVEIEGRTLSHLFGALRDVYAITTGVPPTHEGATPADVAEKFAAHLRARLIALPLADPKPWVVIDFSDDVSDPAVPEFIRMFCADRDANQFDNCVIFVLGPTAHLDSMRGELPNMQIDDLRPVAQTEIFDAATALNQRGSQRLDDVALNARVTEIYADVTQLAETARMPALRQALLKLRHEVRAP